MEMEHKVGFYVGATGLAPQYKQNRKQPETNQGAPSMSKSMETNTAAIYLRKSTEDDGKSVAQQAGELRTKVDQLGVGV